MSNPASPSPPAVDAHSSATLRGMGFMLVFAFLMSSMITGVRHLSDHLHPFEIAFFRMFFGFLVLSPVFIRHGLAPLRTGRFHLHAARGALHVSSVLLFFLGVSLTPLAKAMAISFSAPLFATVLAIVFLGEVVRVRRISALIVGFLGTIVVLRPGMVALDTGSMAILGAAACWGSALILIKMLSRTEASMTITLYSTILMTPVTLLAALPFWQMPSWQDLGWLAMIGALGSAGHLALARAMKEADVTAVLPVEFTKIVWAALFGFILFAEVPDWATIIGAAMIFAGVTYIAIRERQLHGPDRVPAAGANVA